MPMHTLVLPWLLMIVVGPHIGLRNAWPMSLLIQAQTTDNDAEIMGCLEYVLKTAKLGLIHESVDVNSGYAYTSKSSRRNDAHQVEFG